jgi:DNA gyrase/topoisomerase IV subunit A
MVAKTQKYSEEKISKVLEHIKSHESAGDPIEYEIKVDGMMAVGRTKDPGRFHYFEQLLDEDSKKVEVIIYKGSSNHNERWVYNMQEEISQPLPQARDLSGIDTEALIEKRLAEEKQKLKTERLEEDNQSLRAEIEDLEELLEKKEEQIEKLKAELSPLNAVLGELGSRILSGVLRDNPKLLKAFPGGEVLTGLLSAEEQEQASGQTPIHVEFKEEAHKDSSNTFAEEAQNLLHFLKEKFGAAYFPVVMDLLLALSQKPEKTSELIAYLHQEPKSHE